MTPVLLALGSNMGERLTLLYNAVSDLENHDDINVHQLSSFYFSKPQGGIKQSDYVNQVIRIHTSCSPTQLLQICLAIEARHGRTRSVRWGARTLDIDIIDYGGLQLQQSDLILPHSRAHLRDFVIQPMIELLGPQAIFQHKSLAQWLELMPLRYIYRVEECRHEEKPL